MLNFCPVWCEAPANHEAESVTNEGILTRTHSVDMGDVAIAHGPDLCTSIVAFELAHETRRRSLNRP